MTIEEKRRAIKEHCDATDCDYCPIYQVIDRDRENCTEPGNEYLIGADIERNYAILFGGSEPITEPTTEPTKITRESILDTAKQMVCGHREQDYGSPEDNFARIANLWMVYLGVPITPVDVAMMMALLKIARIKSGTGTADSFIDLAGYAACGGEIATRKEK